MTKEKLEEIGDSRRCPVVAILRGRRLLIGLRHYTPDKWKTVSVWTMPGGRCDDGEAIGVTLRREVAEETGIARLEVTDFLGAVAGAKEGDEVYVFAGTTDEEPELREPEKFSEWRWVDVGEVPPNFINPASLELVRAFVSRGGA